MSHIHNIIDDDRHFVVDPITRQITNTSSKLVISQYDHDSERFTFEIPRYIEEHDMAECDRIEVHFTNITRTKKEQNDDTYIVEDVQSDRNAVFFSWLVSRNATQLVGSLKFSVTFLCFDDDGNEVYNWGTDIFDSIQVIARLENTESVVESNPDLIESMKKEILESISSSGGGVDEAEVEKIIENYLTENPPARGDPGEDGTSPTIDVEEIEGGYRITIVDVNDTETFDILNGIDGVAGADGEDGVSPTISVEEIEGGNQLTITDINGAQTINVMNGVDGKDGEDGHTPVKGVDYYTEAEKTALADEIYSSILNGADLRTLIKDLINQILGGTTTDDTEVVLLLGGEEDESDVLAKVDGTEYPVLNANSPVLADDEENYTIEVS